MLLTVVGTYRVQAQQRVLLPASPSSPQATVAAQSIPPDPTPPVTASAVSPYTASSQDLQDLINTWTVQNGLEKWGISLQELNGEKRSASYQEAGKFEPASTFKLFVVANMFQRLADGSLKPDDVVTEGYTVDSCITRAIVQSDNVCPYAFAAMSNGWNRIQKTAQGLGFTQVKLNTNPIVITPHDMGLFISKLYDGQLLNAADSARLIGHMHDSKYRKGIPLGCTDCSVANKVGDNPDALNDVALVTHGDITYSLAILSHRGTYAQIADLTNRIDALLLQTTTPAAL